MIVFERAKLFAFQIFSFKSKENKFILVQSFRLHYFFQNFTFFINVKSDLKRISIRHWNDFQKCYFSGKIFVRNEFSFIASETSKMIPKNQVCDPKKAKLNQIRKFPRVSELHSKQTFQSPFVTRLQRQNYS